MQPYTLASLEERLRGMYRAVQEGRFSEALRQVNTLLALIPLTIVLQRREVDDLKELLTITRFACTSCRSNCPVPCLHNALHLYLANLVAYFLCLH